MVSYPCVHWVEKVPTKPVPTAVRRRSRSGTYGTVYWTDSGVAGTPAAPGSTEAGELNSSQECGAMDGDL